MVITGSPWSPGPTISFNVTSSASRDNKKTFSEDVRLVFLNSNTHKPHQSDGTVRNNFWRAHLKKAQVHYRGPNTARHTFISQLLTADIAKEWIIRLNITGSGSPQMRPGWRSLCRSNWGIDHSGLWAVVNPAGRLRRLKRSFGRVLSNEGSTRSALPTY